MKFKFAPSLPAQLEPSTFYMIAQGEQLLEIHVTNADASQVRRVPLKEDIVSDVVSHVETAPDVSGPEYFWLEPSTGMLFVKYENNGNPVWVEAATSVANVTLTGVQTLTNKTLTGYTETVYNLTGTAITVANGTIQTKTLSANTTFTESLADGQSVILGITAGAYSVTWPSVTWVKVGGSGVAPTLTSAGVNWIILWQVGGVVHGSFMGTA